MNFIKTKEGNRIIKIPSSVIKTLKMFEQSAGSNESGGILLGQKIRDEEVYEIISLTCPGPEDISFPNSFIRKKDRAQSIVNKAWRDSGGILNYIGEWHTHNCVIPFPSHQDLKMMKTILRDGSSIFPIVLMLILGQEDNYTLIIFPTTQKKSKLEFELVRGNW